MGTGYHVLVLAHLICVIGGFGFLAYSGLTLTAGRARGAALGTLEVTLQVGGLAELLVYGAFIFGVAAVATSGGSEKFSQAWVSAGLALYLVAIGVLHGVIRRSQREYLRLARRVAAIQGPVLGTPEEVPRIEALEKRMVAGWGIFNLVVVAVVALMVFRP